MHTLPTEQQTTLIEIINEEHGSQLEFDDFADAILGIFEDIPGFETISQSRTIRIINRLWRIYRGQNYRSN